MSKRWILVAAVAAVAALTILVILALGLRHPQPTNLLLISVDTLRPDHLGCYGDRGAATPTIDRLSREGVTFDDALCTVPLTLPSHSSLMTGLSPLSHGVRDNGNFKLADDFVTLAEVLRANGYATGAAIGAFILDARFGLAQGFTYYDDDLSKGRQPSEFGYPERTADRVTASAIAWLKTAREPFFLFAHYYDPHAPYEPPAEFAQRFQDQKYDGEIAFTDQEIGYLIAYLGRRNLLKRTSIVLVSDHGEGLGEHGEMTHGILLYDPTLKVPLIVRVPEKSPFARKQLAGTHRRETVSLSDVFPTVLELLGLKQIGEVDGRSLVPLFQGKEMPPVVTYFEALASYYAYRWCPLRGARFNQWKYILAPEEELYDVNADPGENANLAAANPEKLKEMKAALLEAAREETEVKAAATKLGATEARQLRALGYVTPSAAPVPEISDLSLKDPKQMIHLIAEYLEPGVNAFDAGNLELARREFIEFVKADPMNPEAHLHVARVLLELKDYGGAATAYRKVLEIDSTNSSAYFHLGNIAQAEGSMDQALAYYKKALEIMPGSPEGLANVGGVLLLEGDTDSAIVLLEQALEGDPRNTVALMNLGIAYAAKGSGDSALGYFRRLLELEPANLKALMNCASIYVNNGQVDSAIVYFERAAAAAPNDALTFLNLGGAYRQKGLIEKAGAAYEKAVSLEPRNIYALFGLAAVRVSQGRREEAKDLIRKVIEIDPSFKYARDAARNLGLE
ncbi:MAG: sulfatase-like hydrolase/transferase [Candidatus Eisenbacteria bacterium]